MSKKSSLPDLRGQWIDLVKLVGPVQLPLRPQQMIDSYCTIWQKGPRLWAGDGFGSVNEEGVVTMYDQKALYKNGEIVWPGQDGLNAYIRTVDLAGLWRDENGRTHVLAQKNSPVELTEPERFLGRDLSGVITGYHIKAQRRSTDQALTGELSSDCLQIQWSDGAVWKRQLKLGGDWISIKSKCQLTIHTQGLQVAINHVPGRIDPDIWYVNADDAPFPDNKTKGGIDLDSTAIHWSDYVGWQRVFLLTGAWLDQQGKVYGIANHRIEDPTDYRRFQWLFDTAGVSTSMQNIRGRNIRNWIEIGQGPQSRVGVINYQNNRIYWEDGNVWSKQ